MLCYVVLCCVVLCCVVLCCLVLSCLVLSCLVLSYLILSYLILSYSSYSSYLILSYLILSYPILSYPILSYLCNINSKIIICIYGHNNIINCLDVRRECEAGGLISRVIFTIPWILYVTRGLAGPEPQNAEICIYKR